MIELKREEQLALLSLARKTIADRLSGDYDPGELDFSGEIYKNRCGAFVTLHVKGTLRGCIGNIIGTMPIPDTVIEMAKASAFKDPRFNPLTREEYGLIDIEISILSPIEAVKDVSDIVVGRDGLIISRGYNSGLLLPQVPVEQKWDRETFLAHTCYKAGLPGDSWKKDGIKMEKFSAQVFGEKELGLIK
jgi:AmmeMemoRadiSam system protein A